MGKHCRRKRENGKEKETEMKYGKKEGRYKSHMKI